MVPTSIRKQLSNQHPNLDRFWSQLDSILGGFGGPRWGQDGTKSLQKSIQKSIEKMITFWIASRSIFDRFWAPTWPPRGVTDLYFLVIFFALGPLLGPRAPQDPFKRPLGTPKTPPGRLLGPILDDFGLQVNGFESQLGRFSTPT